MFALQEKEIHVRQLKLGMYVSRLEIPWEMTRFPLQGLYIQSQEDIERLAECCEYVVVDLTRRTERATFEAPPLATVSIEPRKPKSSVRSSTKKTGNRIDWKQQHCVEHYPVATSMQKELKSSAELLDTVEHQVYLLCEHTLRCRRANIEQLVEHTTQVVESVIRNPDAMAWLCRVRATRKPIYMHTIRLAVWGAIVGRQLGLNRFSLTHLCSALLMTGIGKSRISEKALAAYHPEKPKLAYQAHLKETIYQLEEMRFKTDVLSTIANYCERVDGSGYPLQKSGDNIPFLARICGLIETYELLINPYHFTRAVSPANAVVYLNKRKGTNFEESLVEEFIRAIGIYPTGTLVELNDGQLGVVLSQNYEKRLRASVIPILNAQGGIIDKYKVLDLSYDSDQETIAERLFIRRGVPSTVIPRGLLENAHTWMFDKSSRFQFLTKPL